MSQALFFNSFTVEYVNLTRFAVASFVPNNLRGKPNRRNTVTVGRPHALIARKDGAFTIRGSKKEDTRRVLLRNGVLRLTDFDGVTTDYHV